MPAQYPIRKLKIKLLGETKNTVSSANGIGYGDHFPVSRFFLKASPTSLLVDGFSRRAMFAIDVLP